MKKVFVFAIFVLAATAVKDSSNLNKNALKKALMEKAFAKFKKHPHKRDDSCEVIKCGKKGDSCNDNTVCQAMTECRNDTCKLPTVGSECDYVYGCHDDSLYCDSFSEKCEKYSKEGDYCDLLCPSKNSDLYCDILNNKCVKATLKKGDSCTYGSICKDSICSASLGESDGKCVSVPNKAGADCSLAVGCDISKYLRCSSETNKCVEYPKEGEKCYYSSCNKGLYCTDNDVCAALKGVNEDCDDDDECKDSLMCAKNGKCEKTIPGKGDYCDDSIECTIDYKCSNNVCVKKDETCEDVDDCKYI